MERCFRYDCLREPAVLEGDFLRLRARRDGTYALLDAGLYAGENRICGGYALSVEGEEIPPAVGFAEGPAGWTLPHRLSAAALVLTQEVFFVDGAPALAIALTLQNLQENPRTLDLTIAFPGEGEWSQDVVTGAIHSQTTAGTLLCGTEEGRAILPDAHGARQLTTRLQLSALAKGQAVFYLALAPDKKEAAELLRYLRGHAMALEQHKWQRLALWARTARAALPDPALEAAWNGKALQVEARLRLLPGGQRLPVERDRPQVLVSPTTSSAYEALLDMGLFELFAQGMLQLRDASLAFAPGGCAAGKVDTAGQVVEIGDSLSTARYVCLAYDAMCWTGDEGMVRTLFPFLKQNMDYLSLVSGAFGSSPGAVSLASSVQPEVARACRAYARILKALHLPGDAEYRAHAERMGLPPEKTPEGGVEALLGDQAPRLSEGGAEALYDAVPQLMHGLFGLRPRAHRKELVCAPALPLGWDAWTLSALRIGQEQFTLGCTRQGGRGLLTIHTEAKGWTAVLPGGRHPIEGETRLPITL